MIKPDNIETYIQSFPEIAQKKLKEIRGILKSVAPNATEELKWGKPVLIEKRILFSYSAYKHFISFMPTGPTLAHFKEELKNFKTGKDTIQFPYDQALPLDLIKKIAQHRYRDVMENDAKWMY
ncbi:iron chaperone [Cecembia calidifontis]|jgi:uncharacterized protein YdhG (YjbR/CyaY superfamily)|uniref:Uncharacterized protein YdhG (YjbR/CyaY superfamily) n=1 Tax=Cecembia calidifontis TaxID=1187080 RepID=A0A4Q7P6A0_9BACT|nr:DUF1801 domain-containing protein [Cecembia calidifontis]RZS95514.1 uncharacterized protein YdhG (YjbR/CyaY superfamily) [Cecembia calidifontis]